MVSKYNRDVSIRSVALIAIVVACLEATLHFHLAYWRDILEQTSKASGHMDTSDALSMLVGNSPIILACLAALTATRAAGRSSAFDGLFVFACIAASMLVRASVGDNNAGQLVALVAVLLCLSELARRAEMKSIAPATTTRLDWARHWASLGCLFLALVFISTEAGNRIIAWGNYYVKVTRADGRTLPGPPPFLSNFLVYKSDEPNLFDLTADNTPTADAMLTRYRSARAGSNEMLTVEEYMRTIIEGANLLRSVDYHNRTVFTFDMADLFTYALNMRPTSKGYPHMWVGGASYTTDAKLLPQPEGLLGDADFIMVPRLPFSVSQFMALMDLYGPYLKSNYVQLKDSSHSELWTRKREQ
jgi:hypothetical protein